MEEYMKSKALILTVLTAIALQAPIYACDKNKKEVTKQERGNVQKQKNKREQKKKRLTQKLNRIKRRLVALEKQSIK